MVYLIKGDKTFCKVYERSFFTDEGMEEKL